MRLNAFVVFTLNVLLTFSAIARGENPKGAQSMSASTYSGDCQTETGSGDYEQRTFAGAIEGILQEHARHELLMYKKHLYGYMNSFEKTPPTNPMMATADDIENYLERVDPIAAPAGVLVYWRTEPRASGTTTLCVGLVLSGRRMIVGASPVSLSADLAKLLAFDRATDSRSATPRSLPAGEAIPRPPMDLQALSAALLPPSVTAAIEARRVKTVLVVPVGEIGAAPFPALPLPNGRQLIDYVDVVIAPGFYTLRYPEPELVVKNTSPMVILGDPTLANDPQWNFPPLPGARLEVQQVAKMFGKQAIVGPAASKARFMMTLRAHPQPQLIWFATHAISDPVNPQDGSFLALAGGKLYTREIGKLHMTGHPLVILSACQTGLGKVFDGPGIFGMALTWRYAGAGNVVITMWNVPDFPTRELMVAFTKLIQRGDHTVSALSEAMRTVRSQDSETVDWAGFSVFGDLPMKAAR